MSKQPTGDVTFLFTDIVGSTEMWEEHGDGFLPVLQAHNAILNDSVSRYRGHLFKTEGDAYKVAFSEPGDAVKCALLAQAALQRYPWPADVGPLHVRMAVHTGKPFVQADDYFGPPVNRAARILSATHGGEVLVSEDTVRFLGDGLGPETRFVDQGPHQLRDLDEPIRLFQALHPALEQRRFPPPSSLNGHSHNLPQQRLSFVGREAQIAEIAHTFVQGDTRLLTLIGPEGSGKTRLAVQASAEYIDLFPDGVWLVQLARATDLESAAREVAEALELAVPPGIAPLDAVRNHLASRTCLLILDDLGSVPQADNLIREILTGAPSLRCLATARQPLELSPEVGALGEAELPVPEMSRPPEEPTPAELMASETGRLFVEGVHQKRPDFAPTLQSAKTIGSLIRKLPARPGPLLKLAELVHGEDPGEALKTAVGKAMILGRTAVERGKQAVHQLAETPETLAFLQSVTTAVEGAIAPDEEARRWRDLLAEAARAGNREVVARALWKLGNIAVRRREFPRAVQLLRAAHQLHVDLKSAESPAVRRDLDIALRAVGPTDSEVTVRVDDAISAALA